jgi:predicted dithiol-disulfide oxidoreductase (DUF899 family)
MNRPPVVSQHEWQAARDALLAREKELTHALDALAAERRRLPMVALDTDQYQFTAPDGSPATLTDLFDGHRQLVIYHFMLEPGEDHVCGGCSDAHRQLRQPVPGAPERARHPADPHGQGTPAGD